MIWLRLISWVIWRGLVSGAVVGTLLGTLIYPIVGTLYGLFLGGILGAILGFIDGISLAIITGFAYAPTGISNRYPNLVYTAPILINTIPIFIIFVIGAFNPITLENAFRMLLLGSIPITLMAIITHYFAGSFLESTNWRVAHKASRNPPVNVLS